MIKKITLTIIGIACLSMASFSQTTSTTFRKGSFIINMGVTPQTVGNALKPYGFIYEMLKTYNVPVYWVINNSKSFDGVDFVHNNVTYKGGTYIIPKQFLSKTVSGSTVNQRIAYWKTLGMVGDTMISNTTLDVNFIIRSAPSWTMDAQNGHIAVGFMQNAGIPSTAWNWKDPQQLGACDDIFVMPHADPTWATHSNLRNYNRNLFGAIWAGCHAVSVLENLSSGSDSMNFLSTKGLVPFGQHTGGSVPYIRQYPVEPAFQYMGKTDNAHQNGSEQIFFPKNGSRWRPGTHGAKVGVYDPTPINNFAFTPAPVAATDLIGRGFGLSTSGLVCYQGGHNIAKTGDADAVAAQRIYFNFSFQSTTDKVPYVSPTITMPNTVAKNTTVPLSVAVNSYTTLNYSFQWSSTCGGTFSAPTSASTNWTAPNSTGTCIVTVLVTDPCGRQTAYAQPINIPNFITPPTLYPDTMRLSSSCLGSGGSNSVSMNVLSNDVDPQDLPLTITAFTAGSNGTWSYNANGTVTFTPTPGFIGKSVAYYTACDDDTCATTQGTITAEVGTFSNGCAANQVYGITSSISASIASGSGPFPTETVDIVDDLTDLETTNRVVFAKNSGENVTYELDGTALAGDTVRFYMAAAGNGLATLRVSTSETGSSFSSLVSYTASTTTYVKHTFILSSTVNYIKFQTAASGDAQDARLTYMVINRAGCLSRNPVAADDVGTEVEDSSVTINVIANDIDPASEALTIKSILSQPTKGKVSINLNNTITYINNKDVSGRDSFTYIVTNASGYSDTAMVVVIISDDGCSSGQYKALSGSVSSGSVTASADNYLRQDSGGNDNYGSNNTLLTKAKTGGTKQQNPILYFDISTLSIPSSATVTSATFKLYRTAGTKNNSAVAIPVTIRALTQSFNETQSTWTLRSTGNNWTTPGGSVTATGASSTTWSATLGEYKTANVTSIVQNWVTTPSTNFGLHVYQNPQTTEYKSEYSSQNASSNKPTLEISYSTLAITCKTIPNRPPMAQPDYTTVTTSAAVTIPVISNDGDNENNTLTLNAITTSPSIGSASISGNNIIYTPDSTYAGNVTLRYRVSDGTLFDTAIVYITCVNKKPIARNDTASALSNTTIRRKVKANDSDPDGPATLYVKSIFGGPVNGTASIVGTDSIIYTPASPSFSGPDTMYYVISEGSTGCGTPLLDTAMYIVTMRNRPPVPQTDYDTIFGCTTNFFAATINDVDPEGGNLTLSFISTLENGVTQNSTTTVVGNQIQYVPSLGFKGDAVISYSVTDNGVPPSTTNGTILVHVDSVPFNHKPVAYDDRDTTQMNTVWYITVLDNDVDVDYAAPLEVTIPAGLLAPSKGTVSVLANGTIQYTPNTGASGRDSFQYQVSDTFHYQGSCYTGIHKMDTAMVRMYISIPPPVALDTAKSFLNPGGTTRVQVPDLRGRQGNTGFFSSGSRFVITTLPTNGNLYYNGTLISTTNYNIPSYNPALLTFDPTYSGAGSHTFTFQAYNSNDIPSTNTGTVNIEITALSISGTVYDDGNALVNSIIDGTGVGSLSGSQLYAVLVDTNNVTIAVDTVNSNGTYAFTNLNGYTYYQVIIGSTSPIHSNTLPSGWNNTAEQFGTNNAAGSGIEGGTANGVIAVRTSASSVTDVNIGVNKIPVAYSKSYINLNPANFNNSSGNTTYPLMIPLTAGSGTADGAVSLDGSTYMPGKLSGTDQEDGNYGGSTGGNTGTMVLMQLPNSANTVLVYSGVILNPSPANTDPSYKYWNSSSSRYEIPNFKADSLAAYFSRQGQDSFDFKYAFKDASGTISNTADYSVKAIAPLPVKLLAFDAIKWNVEDVKLTWTTASEINNSHFEVQRSADVKNWSLMGIVQGNGTSNVIHNYSYIDNQPMSGDNYYRLKQVDFDGNYEFTDIRIVSFLTDNNSILVYPNPTEGEVTVAIDRINGATPVDITVSDMAGRVVMTRSFEPKDGLIFHETINLGAFEKGFYQINIQDGTGVKTVKILKF